MSSYNQLKVVFLNIFILTMDQMCNVKGVTQVHLSAHSFSLTAGNCSINIVSRLGRQLIKPPAPHQTKNTPPLTN